MSLRRARALGVIAVALAVSGCTGTPQHATPVCPPGGGDALFLWAQAVPSAAFVPCIEEYPIGWAFGGQEVESGKAEMWLDSDRAGIRAVTIVLTESCDVSGTSEIAAEPDAAGLRKFEDPRALSPTFVGNRYYVFPGGCITVRFAFSGGSTREMVEITDAMAFVSRNEGVEALEEIGLELCGRGVDCPG